MVPTIPEVLGRALNYILGLVGVICVVMLVVGGIFYMTAGGDERRAELGKKTVTYAVIGLAIALVSLIIVRAVAGVV
jgi:hypothetical protein